ncbi:fibroblast growth factor receptor homolog 1-like isoform 4-T5 [Salvelinus alpinus]|uniref:fibroblast growth factor receptor homolog 1-like isoform X2 n=1 Tax=Salvelinus alpinus TaxID=8036 RepID=UPI0039FD943F
MNLDRSCLNILPAWALGMKATYTLKNRKMSYRNATNNHTGTSLIRNSNITNDLGHKFSDPIVGATLRRVAREVSIMRKLGTHKNVLQLLDWNITQAPYMLILESVSSGTLRSFLQVNQDQLSRDSQLQNLFTTAAYHIAHAMRHLCSKMVVHCDLALRNIMVNHFPREVKLAEFGLAQDLTHKRSYRSSCKGDYMQSVPLRWYPPEYFKKNNYYSFKGDVWAFGIVLWEMQTFGTLPYPNLEAPELVVRYVCSGQRNSVPETCRPEILQTIRDCWLEPNTQRPSFNDIVRDLENILEDDEDYVKVDNGVLMANIEFGDQGQI